MSYQLYLLSIIGRIQEKYPDNYPMILTFSIMGIVSVILGIITVLYYIKQDDKHISIEAVILNIFGMIIFAILYFGIIWAILNFFALMYIHWIVTLIIAGLIAIIILIYFIYKKIKK